MKQVKLDEEYGLFIGGEWVKATNGETFESTNPSTEEPLARFQSGTSEDIDAAVRAARNAFASWQWSSVSERSELLYSIANVIQENIEYLATLESMDNGKPIRETMHADLPLSIDHFKYFASVIKSEEHSFSTPAQDLESFNYQEPLGVVGQIIPWNFPLLMAAWKIAPALASGNCIVLKPAEQTPLSIMALTKLIQPLLPPGVLNVVTGFGPTAGAALTVHPDVNKIAFTGSSEVGKTILKNAAQTMKPVTLELGGKSPNIVFPDADLARAAEGLVLALALNQGEVCTCGSRAFVHKDIYEEMKQRIIAKFENIVVGDPMDPKTMMGSQASKEQYHKTLSYIELAEKNGMKILTGGKSLDRKGFFIEPTIIETDNGSKISQEEIFGPVMALIPFESEEQVISLANDTIYGLAAGIWTSDIRRVRRMSQKIQAGRVWVNTYHQYPANAPFGGYKESGMGRENHRMVLDAYRQVKNVMISYEQGETGLFPG